MNLTLGCKEKVGGEWIYILKDGTRMSEKKWTGLVEQQVKAKDRVHSKVASKEQFGQISLI